MTLLVHRPTIRRELRNPPSLYSASIQFSQSVCSLAIFSNSSDTRFKTFGNWAWFGRIRSIKKQKNVEQMQKIVEQVLGTLILKLMVDLVNGMKFSIFLHTFELLKFSRKMLSSATWRKIIFKRQQTHNYQNRSFAL